MQRWHAAAGVKQGGTSGIIWVARGFFGSQLWPPASLNVVSVPTLRMFLLTLKDYGIS